MCPVLAIIAYLSRTKPFCGNDNAFFVSFAKRHMSVKPRILARWLKQVMSAAGIDISMFFSFATRSASAAFMTDHMSYSV